MTTKVVLITGALTGIGRVPALAFAKAGAERITWQLFRCPSRKFTDRGGELYAESQTIMVPGGLTPRCSPHILHES